MKIDTMVYMWIVHKTLKLAEIQGWGVCVHVCSSIVYPALAYKSFWEKLWGTQQFRVARKGRGSPERNCALAGREEEGPGDWFLEPKRGECFKKKEVADYTGHR